MYRPEKMCFLLYGTFKSFAKEKCRLLKCEDVLFFPVFYNSKLLLPDNWLDKQGI